MKKTISLLLTCSIACTMLAGCNTGKNGNDGETKKPGHTEAETDISTEAPDDTTFDTEPDITSGAGLKEPELIFWQVYNPNGFNTFTGIVRNPNSVPVDMSYEIAFYKDGQEVGRVTDFLSIGISTEHDDIIWGNYDIPDSADVDDVKLENVDVSESLYTPLTAKITPDGTEGDLCFYEFDFGEPTADGNVWFCLYNDDNGNGKMDHGELVTAWLEYATAPDAQQRLSFETDAFPYTDVEIYYNVAKPL